MDVQVNDGDRLIVSTDWLCKTLPTSRNAISEWTAKGMPKLSRGRYDFLDVLRYRGLIGVTGARDEDQESATLNQQKLIAEVALKRAQAESVEFKNAVTRGEYVEKKEMTREISEFMAEFKKMALSLPRRIAGELSGTVDESEARRLEADMMNVVRDALVRAAQGEWLEDS